MTRTRKIKLPDGKELKKLMPQYLAMWHNLPKYSQQEISLSNFFKEYPANNNLGEVESKVIMLNNYYSAGLKKIDEYKMAVHILSIPDIDSRLQKGDISIVDEIKSLDTDYCSFASKFCSFHNPYMFPIYDRFVGMVLAEYRKALPPFSTQAINFPPKNQENPKSYVSDFYPIINSFRRLHGLTDYTFKQLDRFLWQLGKEYFVDYSITDINDRYIVILKHSKVYLYELCVELSKGKTQQNGVRGKEYVGVATEEDFDSVRNLLEKHCNYVTRKDGIVGEFYIEVTNRAGGETKNTAKNEIIKVFHKKCFYDIEDGRNKNVIKDILDTLDNYEEISEETFERVCKEKMEENEKKKEEKKKKEEDRKNKNK